MTTKKMTNDYFEWMYHLVCNSESYRKLLTHLNNIDFYYEFPMDGNRFADGVDLRYIYGYENKISSSRISTELDRRPCSVLEMMIALSRRCEEQIMYDPYAGNRTYFWFWSMIKSLGLADMCDAHYSKPVVDRVIHDLMTHRYSRNGNGGLFTVENSTNDFRNVEIWCQMNWYLDSIM